MEVAIEFGEAKVASFLSETWKAGYSAGRIKMALSVLEVTRKVLWPSRASLLDNGLIRSLLDAVKVDRPLTKDTRPYFDVSIITTYWTRRVGNAELPLIHLRMKVISLLTVDLFLRASDVWNFTLAGTIFESGGVGDTKEREIEVSEDRPEEKCSYRSVFCKVGGLKEHRVQGKLWSYFRLPCICKAGFQNSCTCCALQVYIKRSARRRGKVPESDMRLGDGSTYKAKQIFLTHKNKAKAMSLDGVRNDLKAVMEKSGVPDGWSPHSLRGASSSKCVNFGISLQRVLDHGRWASPATFRKHYLRVHFYVEGTGENAVWPIWRAIRSRVTVLDEDAMVAMEVDAPAQRTVVESVAPTGV